MATDLCTTIGLDDKCKVSTVEHLISALVGVGINNATICVNAGEVPVLDGSALKFVERFIEAGICKQQMEQAVFKVNKKFEIRRGDQFISIDPWEDNSDYRLIIDCSIDFCEASIIGKQNLIWEFSHKNYLDIYKARTFCRHVERMAVNLDNCEKIDNIILSYLNRLSDLLFVLARWSNIFLKQKEVLWNPNYNK